MLKTIEIHSVLECARKALTTGNYEEGLKGLQSFWDYRQPAECPRIEGLNQIEIAELLQACGSLYGFYGIHQKNVQETAKNLLTAAYDIFDEAAIVEGQLSCSNYLALTEWRLGDFENVKVWLKNSFDFDVSDSTAGKLHAYGIESLMNYAAGDFEKVLTRLDPIRGLFEVCGDDYLRAMFHTQLGLARVNLNNLNSATNDLLIARHLCEKLGHKRYLSYAENNLAFLHLSKGDCKTAFYYAVRALSLAKKIGDERQIGGVFDTFALISLELNCYEKALFFAEKAVDALQKTENYDYLVKYLETKFKILLKISHSDESVKRQAFKTYAEAYAIAHQFLSEAVCDRLTDVLNQATSKTNGKRQDYKLKAKYKPTVPVHTVEIVSDDYEYLGLKEGWFVVVEEREPRQGDLAAVVDKADGDCFVGFVTLFSDLIMLEIGSQVESPVLSLDTVKILGVVIGYCLPKPDKDGNLKVVPLELRKV